MTDCSMLRIVTHQKRLLPDEVRHVIEVLVNKEMHCG